MERFEDKQKKNTVWISLTGYRTLFVLKLLLEKSRTLEELTEALKSNNVTKKSISKDTIRLTINTLKTAGCNISRPSAQNNYRYVLLSHPFTLNISDEEFEILLNLKSNAYENLSWQKILLLNNLYEKIISLTADEDKIKKLADLSPFSSVDLSILEGLSKLTGKKVKIRYYSPRNGDEIFDIVVGKISYSQGKLYLCCFNFKYNSNSLLNLERIKEIITVYLTKSSSPKYLYEVIYEVFGESYCDFEKQDYETVLKTNENSYIVQAFVNNEFCFIQRLLLLGADFKIISPDSFREKLINKIKLIQKGYKNE